MSLVRPVSRMREMRSGLAVIEFETPYRGRLPGDGFDYMEFVRRCEDYANVRRLIERARQEPRLVANQPGTSWVVNTGATAIALTPAATAKTIIYVNAGATDQPILTEVSIGFDGISASAVPALVEATYGTKATNSTPGTGSTAGVAVQQRGWPAQSPASAAAINCTAEPTVQTTGRFWLVTPNGGLLLLQLPLSREPTGVASGTALSGNQVGFRATAPAVVNTRGYVEIEE